MDGGAFHIFCPTIKLEILGSSSFTNGGAKNGAGVYTSTNTIAATVNIYDSLFSIIKATHKGSFMYMDGTVYPSIGF